MESLHAKYPDDVEAAAFYALSRIKSSPTPAEIPNQLEAAAILEPIVKANPNHPGAVHYLIHAYDYPSLASRGLVAADHYASLAPWVPHALHMPSHIYTRLGMWQKSIAANMASAEASREYGAKYHPARRTPRSFTRSTIWPTVTSRRRRIRRRARSQRSLRRLRRRFPNRTSRRRTREAPYPPV
jgi:hypothetical protein